MAENQILVTFTPKGDKELINAINKLATAQKTLEKRLKAVDTANKKGAKSSGILNTNHQRLAQTNGLLANSFATIRSKMLLWSFAMSLGIRQISQMAKEAAVLGGMSRAFDTLSGGAVSATVAIDKLRGATNNTMSDFDLFQQANNAMILGVSKNSDEMSEMFDIAQRLGRALGRDTRMSVESLITGIGRQSRLMLDNIGIIVKSEEAYEAYAKALGKSTDDLTDSQKKQAFLTATMESARKKVADLGAETLTSVDKFDQLSTAVDNLQKRLGDAASAFIPLIEGATNFLDVITDERIDRFIRSMKLIGDIIKGAAIILTGLFVAALIHMFGVMSAGATIVGLLTSAFTSLSATWTGSIALGTTLTYALVSISDKISGIINPIEDLTDKQKRFNEAFEQGADTLADENIGSSYETLEEQMLQYGESVETVTNALHFQMLAQNLVRDTYGKTKEGQREILKGNIEYVESLIEITGETKELSAILKMLEDQYDAIGSSTERAAEKALQNAKVLTTSFSNMTSAQSKEVETRMNNELASLKNSERFKKASDKRKADMEKKVTEKYKAERERIAKFEKAGALAQAGINIGLAITKHIANPFMVAFIGAMGAVQLAAIANTPLPKYAKGGLVGGRRHSQGGTMIEAEQGEFVMSRNATQAIGIENLNRMNQGGGGAVNVTFTGNVMSQDFIENEAIPQIKEAIRRGADIGVS